MAAPQAASKISAPKNQPAGRSLLPRLPAPVFAGGHALDPGTRAGMERGFGHDFSKVRIHDDAAAQAATRARQARAFAHGNDIYFNAGQYDTRSPSGRWVLAHELAHVAQFRPAAAPPAPETPRRDLEDEAGAAALSFLRGARPEIRRHHHGSAVHCLGEPESVPDFTFIARALPNDNGFIQSALDYHTDWGFHPRSVETMDEVVTALGGSTAHINRLRLVSHANIDNIFLRLFTGSRRGIPQEEIAGFGFSDVAGLESVLQLGGSSFLFTDTTTEALTALRASNSAALVPFGLDTAGSAPSGDVALLIRRLLDGRLLSIGTLDVQDGGQTRHSTAAERAQLGTATHTIAAELEASIISATAANPTPVTAADIQALETAIGGLSLADLQLATISSAIDVNIIRDVAAANPAIAGGFRGRIDTVKQRFDSTSAVDIRGCRLGQNPDYMRAVQCFFGRGGNLPEVTAPEWFQSFPSFGFNPLANEAGVDAAASGGFTVGTTSLSASDVSTGLSQWSALTGSDTQLQFWTGLFSAGSVNFVSLNWRSGIPALQMESEIDSVATAGFTDMLNTFRAVFNVPASSLPNAQQIAALQAKQSLASSLVQASEQLQALQTSGGTPDPNRLQALEQQLTQLEQQISPPATPAVPATTTGTPGAGSAGTGAAAAPAPTLSGLQSRAQQLQTTLGGQLTAIDGFLAAVAARLQDPNAGLRFYLNLGWVLPVQSATTPDDIIVLVMNSMRNAAIGRWLRVQWRGNVPATAPALQQPFNIRLERSRRLAALSDAHQATQVVYTPTPDYMSHIVRLNGGNFTCTATGSNATVQQPGGGSGAAAQPTPAAAAGTMFEGHRFAARRPGNLGTL